MHARCKGARLLIWLGISFAALIALTWLGMIALRMHYAGELGEMLASIRAKGEPVLPADIPKVPRGSGEEPTQWLAELEALDDAAADWSGVDLPECAAEVAALGADALDRDFEAKVAPFDGAFPPSPCHVAMLRRQLELERDVLQRALEVGRYSFAEAAAESPADDPGAWLTPRASPRAAIRVTDVLARSAVDSAARGDGDLCVERLLLAAHATALLEHSPNLIGFLCRESCVAGTLWALHAAAVLLPRDADLSPLDGWLADLDLEAELLDALLAERAAGNAIFGWVRTESAAEGSFFADQPLSTRALIRLWLDHDHAEYLRRMGLGIDAVRRRDFSGVDDAWVPSWREIVTCMILPRLHQAAQSADEVTARRDLVRATLIARRDGLEAARAWITSQRDPCGRASFFARPEPDSARALWPVGTDGVDDGGVGLSEATGPRPLDIVVRCREP